MGKLVALLLSAIVASGVSYGDTVEAVKFWQPVAEGIGARLKARGLEKSLMMGIGRDLFPAKVVIDAWKEVLPGTPWVFQGHPCPERFYDVPVHYSATVWSVFWASDPSKARLYGWKEPMIRCYFDRGNWRYDAQTQLLECNYLAGEKNISGRQCWFGRMSADFWPVLTNNRGRKYPLATRYPNESGSERYRP